MGTSSRVAGDAADPLITGTLVPQSGIMAPVSQSSLTTAESRTSFADYRTALTTPGSRGPVVASVLARLPIAMIGISALFYVQRETGSFTSAGLVSAGSLAGVAVGAVIQGRLMDRFGPTRPLVVTATLL